MKLFILFLCIFNVLCYKIPFHNTFSIKNSEFTNKRFPVKLDPVAEYRRAKFFEERRKIHYRKQNLKKMNITKN